MSPVLSSPRVAVHVLTLGCICFADAMVRRALLPQYVISLVCASASENPSGAACDARSVVDAADSWTAHVMAAGNAAALLSISALGFAGDRLGRRPVYLFVMAFMALDYAAIALAPSLGALVVAHAVANLGGNLYSALPIGFAMVADDGADGGGGGGSRVDTGDGNTGDGSSSNSSSSSSSSSRSREFDFTATEGGIYFALLVGPLAGGSLQRWASYRAGFFAAAGLVGVVWAACALRLRETLPAGLKGGGAKGGDAKSGVRRRAESARGARDDDDRRGGGKAASPPPSPLPPSPLPPSPPSFAQRARGVLLHPTSPLSCLEYFSRSRLLALLCAACLFEWVGKRGLEYVLNLAGKQQLDLGAYEVGVANSAMGAGGVWSNFVLVRLLGRGGCCCGGGGGGGDGKGLSSAHMVVVAALIAAAAAVLLLGAGVAASGSGRSDGGAVAQAMFYGGSCLFGIGGGMISPTLRGLLSRAAGPAQQGRALGNAATLEVLAGTVAPLLFGALFHAAERAGQASLAFLAAFGCSAALIAVCRSIHRSTAQPSGDARLSESLLGEVFPVGQSRSTGN